MRRIILIPLGIGSAVIGVFGILVPVIPGFLFLIAAALCFAFAFSTVRNKLSETPRFDRLFRRIDRTAHLPIAARLKMTFWALLEAALPKKKVHNH